LPASPPAASFRRASALDTAAAGRRGGSLPRALVDVVGDAVAVRVGAEAVEEERRIEAVKRLAARADGHTVRHDQSRSRKAAPEALKLSVFPETLLKAVP
jgi:hypothetical protein